jgi:hypothetical protein
LASARGRTREAINIHIISELANARATLVPALKRPGSAHFDKPERFAYNKMQ